jgi:hypothetical protein
VADQRVEKSGELLAKELSKIKALLTCNSSSWILPRWGDLQLEVERKIQPVFLNLGIAGIG